MRITTTIDRLNENQWRFAQRILQTSYDIPKDASRVCLVVEHQGEERHAEVPLFTWYNLAVLLNQEAVIHDQIYGNREKARDAVDPARCAVLAAEWERVDPEGVAALRESAAELNQP